MLTFKAMARCYNGVSVLTRPAQGIPRGWLLVRVQKAVWSPLESAVASGRVWVEPGRVVGWAGTGVPVEAGVDAPSTLLGRLVTIYSFRHGIPGIDYDGWLAEYTVLPADSLKPVEGLENPLIAPLYALAATAAHTLAEHTNTPAIFGGGVTAVLTAYASARIGLTATVYTWRLTPEARRLASQLHVRVESPSTLGGGCDAVFVATLDPSLTEYAASVLRPNGLLLLHPVTARVSPPTIKQSVRILVLEEVQEIVEGARLAEEVGENEKLFADHRPGLPGTAPQTSRYIIYSLGAP